MENRFAFRQKKPGMNLSLNQKLWVCITAIKIHIKGHFEMLHGSTPLFQCCLPQLPVPIMTHCQGHMQHKTAEQNCSSRHPCCNYPNSLCFCPIPSSARTTWLEKAANSAWQPGSLKTSHIESNKKTPKLKPTLDFPGRQRWRATKPPTLNSSLAKSCRTPCHTWFLIWMDQVLVYLASKGIWFFNTGI